MNPSRRFLLLLAAASALISPALLAQAPAGDAPAPASELTLEECIARALRRNFDLEIQRYGPQIAKDSIEIARDGFVPVLSVTTSRSETKDAATTLSPGVASASNSTRLGVTQQFYSGTTVSVSSQLDRSRIDPAVTALNPAYDADLTVSVRQQLLKGFGTDANKAAVNRARIGFDKANLDYKVVALNIIQSTENAYYNVVFAREQFEVRKFSLALAERLFDEAKTRRDTGVATDLDVLQAEVGVANARRGVLLAQQSVKDTEQQLLALIGQFELETQLGAARFKELDGSVPLFASSYNMAKQTQPDYLSAQAGVEQAKLDVTAAKSNSKPSLSVGGAVGLNGHRGSSSDAINDAFDNTNHSWQVDLSFTYPLGQVGDKARLRQSLAVLSQSQTRLRQIEQNIELEVRSAVRAVETNLESVKISAQARELSEKQYELEKAKFDAGLSTSYRVLQVQNDLENARVAELQSKVSLRTSLAALHRLEGSSFQRYGVNLP
ncbi:MAG: TolC family protein [Opitutae bacterium]|nr:TolC family protein [Opitutae bacterium]